MSRSRAPSFPPLPAQSILDAGGPPFKRSKFTQAMIDCLCVAVGVLFASVSALALVGSLFVLFFVRL